MEHIWKSFKEILIEPYDFFSKKLYLKRAVEYVLVLYLITFIFSTLYKVFTSSIPVNQALMTVLVFLLGLIAVVLLILISALIFHLILSLFRVKNNFKSTSSIFGYCLTPLILANLFFFLQYFYYLIVFFIVWNVTLLIIGISHYYNISKIKSFFIVLISYLIILLLTGFISGLVVK